MKKLSLLLYIVAAFGVAVIGSTKVVSKELTPNYANESEPLISWCWLTGEGCVTTMGNGGGDEPPKPKDKES